MAAKHFLCWRSLWQNGRHGHAVLGAWLRERFAMAPKHLARNFSEVRCHLGHQAGDHHLERCPLLKGEMREAPPFAPPPRHLGCWSTTETCFEDRTMMARSWRAPWMSGRLRLLQRLRLTSLIQSSTEVCGLGGGGKDSDGAATAIRPRISRHFGLSMAR